MTRLRIQAISTLAHAALVFLALTYACLAQTPFNPGDADTPTPKAAQPVPLNPVDWKTILFPAQCPDGTPAALNTCGDGRDGYHWQWDSFTSRMELRPPKIIFGPGAISSPSDMGGSLSLTQNAWNNLYSAVIGGTGINKPYRFGMTAYLPRGSYIGMGQVAIATGGTANVTYTVRVLMGTCLKTTGNQTGVLVVPGADGSITTNNTTAIGSPVLNFAATTCIIPGMIAYDVTHPGAISPTSGNIKVSSVGATTVTLSGNVVAPGVSNGDQILFGFVVGYGGPVAWPGAGALSFIVPFQWSSGFGCLAADRSNQQCEWLTQVFTTGAGDSIQIAGVGIVNPPYPTYQTILRMDGGYGAQ